MISEFSIAEHKFEDLLISNGLNRSVTWIFREGTTIYRRRWIIDINATESGILTQRMQELYDHALSQNLGIRFTAVGCAGGVTYAYIFIPENEADASNAMLSSNLHFTLNAGSKSIRLTQSRIWFSIVRLADQIRGYQGPLKLLPQLRRRGVQNIRLASD